MPMNMKLMLTKSRTGVDLPLDTTLEIDGQAMTVLGLAKTEVIDGLVCQWWIVENETAAMTAK